MIFWVNHFCQKLYKLPIFSALPNIFRLVINSRSRPTFVFFGKKLCSQHNSVCLFTRSSNINLKQVKLGQRCWHISLDKLNVKATNNELFLGKRKEKTKRRFSQKTFKVTNRFRYFLVTLVYNVQSVLEALFTVHLQPQAFSLGNFQAIEATQDRITSKLFVVLAIGEGTLREIFAAFSILSSFFSFSQNYSSNSWTFRPIEKVKQALIFQRESAIA